MLQVFCSIVASPCPIITVCVPLFPFHARAEQMLSKEALRSAKYSNMLQLDQATPIGFVLTTATYSTKVTIMFHRASSQCPPTRCSARQLNCQAQAWHQILYHNNSLTICFNIFFFIVQVCTQGEGSPPGCHSCFSRYIFLLCSGCANSTGRKNTEYETQDLEHPGPKDLGGMPVNNKCAGQLT